MSDEQDFKDAKKKYHDSAGLILAASIKHFKKKKYRHVTFVERLTEFKKGIFEGIEDNSGDATSTEGEYDETDDEDHFDAKPDYDKMMDDEDDEPEEE